jgi:hypothetical protein
MKTKLNLLIAGMFLVATSSALATVRYVNVNNANPTAPYTNWATAATDIQDAVDAAGAGDEILVTNGVYATGGATDPNGDFDIVVVDTPVTLQSVNGPEVTVIDGGGTNECLYLATNTVMVGFTLTNGVGGVFCESTNAVLTNCVLTGNFAYGSGGGAFGGTLNNCTLTGNMAHGYYVLDFPQHEYVSGQGGGAYSCALNNCTLTGNWTSGFGGGACSCTLNNCTLTGNMANGYYVSEFTFFPEYVSGQGGGAYSCALNNCILYFNSDRYGGNYDPSSTLNYCCTTPLPTTGVGNISADPQLASATYLSPYSPCIGAGSAAYVSGTDIDGDAWNNPPSIGCDEYHAGAVTGPLTVAISADYTNVATGFPVGLTAFIEGRTDLSVWDFGDGYVAVNEPYTSHTWTAPGDYLVALWAFNDSCPGGVSAMVTVHVVAQPVYYVALSSTSPVAPYSSWATAANNIQDAVDAASVPGALVLVSNGSYAAVTVYTPLTVQSVNGPDVTVINGGGTQECVYLTNDAVMVGFTLTNGVAGYSGGGGVYCESTNAVLTNCVLTGNSTTDGYGGGAYGGTLNNCTLTGNSATNWGGGTYSCTLNNCTLTGNTAGGSGYVGYGGGAYGGTLNNCTLTGNSASAGFGGGAYESTLNICTLTGNSAPGGFGGGPYSCTLNNCVLTGNSAWEGGGAYGGTLNNCTLTGNSADDGGGAFSCTLNNCIVYFNSDTNGGNYDSSCTLNYCCTTPLPTYGVGNISADPQLASASHLSAESPCIGVGSAAYASGTDIDGEPWANPPSIGCEEYHAGAVTGPLTVSLTATFTNVATGFPVGLTALIEGRADLSVWDFGDGSVVSNHPYTSHAWTAPGDYLVALRAFNDSCPEGVSATVTVHVDEGLHYVAASSGNPVAPYTSWATAAMNIQDAVNVAGAGGAVFVTNGTYGPVTVNTPLTLQSVNGPDVTVINGGGAATCVYLTNDALMVGFTLTNGIGGVYCEANAVLTNCVLSGNSASYGGGANGGTLNNCTLSGNSAYFQGGGAYSCNLNNCTLTRNSAYGYLSYENGGGAYGCTLNNCTLTGNSALYFGYSSYGGGAASCWLTNCKLTGNSADNVGGGAGGCILNNCTLAGNSASYTGGGGAWSSTLHNCIVYLNAPDNYDYGTLNYCCTTPDPGGVGNITNDPAFVDYSDGNLRLQSNSPCINAGDNAYVVGSTDLDGNPRIVGGTVDIGAYEYQTPVSMISYAWLQQYGLPINTNTDTTDLDGTGMNVYQDWIAGLNPTNASSVLQMTSATPTNNPGGLVVTWQSVSGIMYFLQSSTNLEAQPAFSTIQSNIAGQAGTTSYKDTNAVGSGPYFYRVGVGN